MICPCGSNLEFNACCGAIISGDKIASTAEQLMRSRYSAYTLANIDYIIVTMRGNAAENFDPVNAKQWAISVKWIGLKVINTKQGLTEDDIGWVEFKARYKENGKMQLIHELSEFHRIDGLWYYVDGKHLDSHA